MYQTVSQITGSYTQAAQVNDPDVIEELVAMKPERTVKTPPWWRFTDVMHKLTDIADQLIAARASSEDVKFYPRPVNPAVKLREARVVSSQEDRINKSRRANAARRKTE